MKYLPHLLSVLALFLVLAKIHYDEQRNRAMNERDAMPSSMPTDDAFQPMTVVAYALPDHLDFAGESVPMEIPDVRERLDKELQINSYWHNNTIFWIKRANRWFPPISRILKENGVPDDFKYMPLVESALINDISPKNATGFWQITRDSGKELGLEVNHEVDQRYDPLKSTEAACRYLRKAYARFGNWTLAAASYDRGMNGLDRALDNQQVDSYYDLYLNDETSRYVFRILACKMILEHPEQYGFVINKSELYEEEPVRYLEETKTISDLVTFAKQNGINYKLLKRHNPWLRDDKLTIRSGQVYRIALPNSNQGSAD